jgi:hypothetical protein
LDGVVGTVIRNERDIHITVETTAKVFQTQSVVYIIGFANGFAFVANTIKHR